MFGEVFVVFMWMLTGAILGVLACHRRERRLQDKLCEANRTILVSRGDVRSLSREIMRMRDNDPKWILPADESC